MHNKVMGALVEVKKMLIFNQCLDDEKRRRRKKSIREFIYWLTVWMNCWWARHIGSRLANGRFSKPLDLRDTTIS